MPELPEVETTVRELRKHIIGYRVTGFWTDPAKPVNTGSGANWKQLKKRLTGKKIVSVRRRAKYIIIDLDGPDTLFIHQKMSGHLLYGRWQRTKTGWTSSERGLLYDDPKNRFIRMVLSLGNGWQVALSDQRRFGKIMVIRDDQINTAKELKKLGPEPLEISYPEFHELFNKKRGRLKSVLMDPAFIAGIGNIYADEILWEVGLHPLSRVEHLNKKDVQSLYQASKGILRKAIRYQGSSMDDYRLPSGKKGRFQEIHNAYHKTGRLCGKKDKGVIERMKVSQRSAHFCPVHQKLK